MALPDGPVFTVTSSPLRAKKPPSRADVVGREGGVHAGGDRHASPRPLGERGRRQGERGRGEDGTAA